MEYKITPPLKIALKSAGQKRILTPLCMRKHGTHQWRGNLALL